MIQAAMSAFSKNAQANAPEEEKKAVFKKDDHIKIERVGQPEKQLKIPNLTNEVSGEESLYDQFGGDEKLKPLVDSWLKSFNHNELVTESEPKYANVEE